MKVALVHQPWNDPLPPVEAGSIAIWIDQVARRLSAHGEVVVYGRSRSGRWEQEQHGGVQYRCAPLGADPRVLRWLRRWPWRRAGRPYFASRRYFASYTRHVAQDLAQQGCAIAHLFNFPQTVPVVRRCAPRAKIVLHMQCEWLAQLDRARVAAQIAPAAAILGCSEFITASTRTALPAVAARCHTVYNGVDVDAFAPRPRTAHDGPRVLFVGRVSPEKGVHVLLRAFGRVVERHPNASLEIVGPAAEAPAEFMVFRGGDPRLAALFAEHGGRYAAQLRALVPPALAGRVTFTPALAHGALPARYADADVSAVPSIWQEPFGMIAAEAMACATPVVATRTGGLPEVVAHGATGLVVDRDDPEGLAGALLALLDDPERRARLGRAARARAVELFAWDRIAARTREVYEGL